MGLRLDSLGYATIGLQFEFKVCSLANCCPHGYHILMVTYWEKYVGRQAFPHPMFLCSTPPVLYPSWWMSHSSGGWCRTPLRCKPGATPFHVRHYFHIYHRCVSYQYLSLSLYLLTSTLHTIFSLLNITSSHFLAGLLFVSLSVF